MIPLSPRTWFLCIILCVLIIPLPVCAITLSPGSSFAAAPAIAQGDPVYIRGIATGHPRDGLQVWLIGYNYVKISTVSTSDDNTYEYKLMPADTRTLAPGQYFVLVQHPMMNARFDIAYNPATGEVVNRQLGTGTAIYQLTGAGSLQTPDGAGALMRAISSQNIDDTFATTSFIVGNPTAFIDRIGDHAVGDRFTISGSTNLAAGDTLAIEITSSAFKPTQKVQGGGFSGAAGTVTVEPGSGGLNRWSFAVDTAAFRPDEYIVKVSGITVGVTGSSTFAIVEKLPPATVTEPAAVVQAALSPPVTPPVPAPTTQKSPLTGLTGAIALVAGAILATRR